MEKSQNIKTKNAFTRWKNYLQNLGMNKKLFKV